MSNLFNLINLEEVEEIFSSKVGACLGTERISITEAKGRILSQDFISPFDLPPFTRATMDGYAVKAADTFAASEGNKVYLGLVGEVLMGEEATEGLESGQAIRISTGGMLPQGADAVLMVEYTEKLGSELVEINRAVGSGENIVRKGEDISQGETLLKKGSQLRPQDLGALAGLGITEVEVYKRPRVTVFATGDEIINPEQRPQPGEIRDINSYAVISALEGIAKMSQGGIIKDSKEELEAKLRVATENSDVVVLSGGSSVGTKDLTLEVVDNLGEPGVLVHGIAIKPGKPTVLAIVDDTVVIGLPGHPTSALTVCKIVVQPIVERLAGLQDDLGQQNYLTASLSRNLASVKGREEYIRVKLEKEADSIIAVPILGKSSLATTMVEADGVIKIGIGKEGLEKGAEVQVLLF
ncbi:gephyrin-like molybdotransferase Glp [Natroniella sp. ANB-PHB2]|uniref:molybdopterin molybdotransferase MoeA n=1 Tax=Natroniella sp. ANB-PHB2 TaxID=3384444 RepID=UPI0038D4644C